MVLSMGSTGGGSFALSDNSTYLMTLFIENVRTTIVAEFNKILRHMWAMNGHDMKRVPYLEFDEVEPLDWDEFTKGWQRLLQAGGITADKPLEQYFRDQLGAPSADYDQPLATKAIADPVQRLDPAKEA